jgi:hypothetical protein
LSCMVPLLYHGENPGGQLGNRYRRERRNGRRIQQVSSKAPSPFPGFLVLQLQRTRVRNGAFPLIQSILVVLVLARVSSSVRFLFSLVNLDERRAQGDDFRTFLENFVASLPQVQFPAGLGL